MKKIMYVLGFSMLSLLLIYCNNLDAVETDKIYPEELKVRSMDYNQFVVSYNQFYNSLQDSKKEIISEYVRSKMESSRTSKQGRVNGTSCNCNPGQSTCSAETWWSSCCICCNAGTQMACGTNGPFTSCQCEEPASLGRQREIYTSSDFVTIYPKRFDDLFEFAKKNSIEVGPVVSEFEKLFLE